ncbi:MAG: bacterial Ig-like domain-containing protein, partial [Lachnospiraceae bacterium]|nr:bacterial Ig-like domain-containing protein [Lachnospiraceae bacterium]
MKRFLAVFLGAVMVLTCLEFGSVSASAEGNSGVIELPPVLLTGGNTGEIQTPEDLFATLSSIAVTTPPTKTSYLEGKDTLDLTGGILTLTLDDASTQTVALTDEAVTVTGFDNTQVGTDTLTVSYGGKETTFDVTITAKSAASIAIKTAPTKSEYTVGDTLDVTGGEITVTYDNETSADVAITADMVSGFDSSAAAASQTLTVTYEGKTATFD